MERIENRVAAWTQIPVAHQEDTQVSGGGDAGAWGP